MVSAAIIKKYFPDLPETAYQSFERLYEIYVAENEKVNLISRKDIENIYEKHVLHSLALAKKCSFPAGAKVIDIGTGGGFPGIPLAIMFPETEFVLCDSIAKKIRAVNEVITALDLKNAWAVNSRTELLTEKFDIATARAVAPMADLWNWMRNNWVSKPVFYLLKGGDLREEMNDLLDMVPGVSVKQYPIADFFSEEFFETKKVVVITRK